ncbi:hypothetical protein DV702_10945 [Sporosarcina sp. PTS2304]|uniref:hypothetical protein n=1 Tax=Sporosarcina sp. PTS2304 TaxID=2283194 RepID=UPI000E0CCB04|nr:hypothetical protein [Sporosarcina sp. PTS2304]AXI00192.1 hypothetical protein DV702_10945 [Sporosarcina sp. PTS2304]
MLIVLLSSALFLLVIVCMKPLLIGIVSPANFLARKLAAAYWFQQTVWSSLFLFLLNALLFSATAAILFILSYAFIPFLHLPVMIGAVLCSLFSWISIYHADRKSRKQRLVMAGLGSSFYLCLFAFITYRIFTPIIGTEISEQDDFMEFIGLFFMGLVSLTAWFVCLLITGIYRKE